MGVAWSSIFLEENPDKIFPLLQLKNHISNDFPKVQYCYYCPCDLSQILFKIGNNQSLSRGSRYDHNYLLKVALSSKSTLVVDGPNHCSVGSKSDPKLHLIMKYVLVYFLFHSVEKTIFISQYGKKPFLYHSEKNYFYITVKKTIFISQ